MTTAPDSDAALSVSLTVNPERLHDFEEVEHSEMENDEGQYRDEDGFVFAFFKYFLKHRCSPYEKSLLQIET